MPPANRPPPPPPSDDDLLERLGRAIAGLPHEMREVFLMRQNLGLAYGRIALSSGRTEPAVKGLMRAALRRLAAALPPGEGARRGASHPALLTT